MSEKTLNAFTALYQVLRKENLPRLGEVYHSEAVFEDPLHRVEGLEALTRYFSHLYENLNHCHFEIEQSHLLEQRGFLYWKMRLSHKKLNSGKDITVSGHSVLTFKEEKVIHHRDYFDVGEMLYEQLPVIGRVIKMIKVKASDA